MSRQEVLLSEWWELDRDEWTGEGCEPVSLWTVIMARKMHRDDFPKPSKVTPPNTYYYYLSEVRAWKKAHPGLFKGRPVTAGE